MELALDTRIAKRTHTCIMHRTSHKDGHKNVVIYSVSNIDHEEPHPKAFAADQSSGDSFEGKIKSRRSTN